MKEFDLTQIPIHCLSHTGNGHRHININKIAEKEKLNISIFKGPSAGKLGKYESGALSFANLILSQLKNDIFEPFIVIEDDISIYSRFYEKFTYPDDTDAIFLGISSASVHPEIDSFETKVKILQNKDHPHLFHDLNMLSTHGVFFTNKQYATYFAQLCINCVLIKSVPWDIPLARDKPLFNCFALSIPLFYQDSKVGGSEHATKITFIKSTITEDYFDKIKNTPIKMYYSKTLA